MKKSGKKNRKQLHGPRTRLRLPDLDQAKAAVFLRLGRIGRLSGSSVEHAASVRVSGFR
jgi:hypothetical protein